MPWRLLVVSAVICAAVIVATTWLFEISLERAAVLAPLLVVTAGAIVGLVVLWTRIALDPLIRRRHRSEGTSAANGERPLRPSHEQSPRDL